MREREAVTCPRFCFWQMAKARDQTQHIEYWTGVTFTITWLSPHLFRVSQLEQARWEMKKGVYVRSLGPCLQSNLLGDHSSTEKHQMKVGGGRCRSGHAGLPGKLEKPQLELEKGVQVSFVDMSPVPSRLAPDWSKGTQSSLLPDLCEFKECL